MNRIVLTFLSSFLILIYSDGIAQTYAAEKNTRDPFAELCQSEGAPGERIVCANMGALDQALVYNRFGSFNPFGMMFALDRDISVLNNGNASKEGMADVLTADRCDEKTGVEFGHLNQTLEAGKVRLKDCKRPRPIVLRVNVGDTLLIQVNNYLFEPKAPDFSKNYCKRGRTNDSNAAAPFDGVSRGDQILVEHGEVLCSEYPPEGEKLNFPAAPDWPTTRSINLVVQGLHPLPVGEAVEPNPSCTGLSAIEPGGDAFVCKYRVDQEGTYFFASHAAPSGGEGNGGSIVHGLFGAIVAQREGTRWYRSQTSSGAFDAVWPRAADKPRHARTGLIDYEATQDDIKTDGRTPLLNMARVLDIADQKDFANARAVEIVHSDLNAIILCDPNLPDADCHRADDASDSVTEEPAFLAFREFSVFFHDELKAKYTRNFEELEKFGQLAGVKDGFAINYGASGMGSILLANRKGIGPSSDCVECLYEEFFLTSWANGDPALLEWYSDDPSNVHHSYLNDPVVFRNFHAGPKETHVFHLHAHQWFAGNDPSRGAYLDSQTVAPQQGFTYNIYHGGLRGLNGEGEGWWDTQGSGNRNRTLGDSIFHCHLYPHFAQGMWALWRVHDVLEDGTRKLPDGQVDASLSLSFPDPAERKQSRAGTVDRLTGLWIGPQDRDPDDSHGTPVPAIIPLPGDAIPLLPTYADPADIVDLDAKVKVLKADAETPMPGFPFYVAGKPGHRPPQAPMDIARDLGEHDTGTLLAAGSNDVAALIDTRVSTDGWLDGGLGRHVIGDESTRKLGVEIFGQAATELANFDDVDDDRKHLLARQVVSKAFALGDLSGSMTSADIELLPNEGTRLERAAMGFHHNGKLFEPAVGSEANLKLLDATGQDPDDVGVAPWNGSFPSKTAPLPGDGSTALAEGLFYVNGNAPKPGSPFADPCATTSPNLRAAQTQGGALGVDPFVENASGAPDYFRDPFLLGFRRYEVSAVQVDLIVNRAGWHDPQARINVFTDVSDNYKDNGETNRISPVISDTEEPFFFRAMSGECIEFRHTNELPKDLELDDFQVKTPTDTIGQHIHLVKFDVTASDGAGNGWNYEDGTFAPDELATRICNAKDKSIFTAEELAVCSTEAYDKHEIWRLKRSENRHLFQTTVQRWFADPILTLNGDPQSQQLRDRTLRTVFSHDHFAPSSIQQHGFYSALLIEPGMALPEGSPEDLMQNGVIALQPNLASVCKSDETDCVGPIQDGPTPADLPRRLTSVAWGHDTWEGSHRRVKMREPDPAHPDFREFALSIADFALLYDPRDRTSAGDLKRSTSLGVDGIASSDDGPLVDAFGMSQLYCEAKWRLSPYILREICGIAIESKSFAGPSVNTWFTPDGWSPAWIAGGLNRDEDHKALSFGDTFEITLPDPNAPNTHEVADLLNKLIWYRQRAAGHILLQGDEIAAMAKPVAPPFRPESISVDHHDPYLVNYRGAPLPLRIGDKASSGGTTTTSGPSSGCRLMAMGRQGADPAADSKVVTALKSAQMGECSVDRQMAGLQGDMGEVLMSSRHGDAETPVFEAYQNELLAFRMVQGAQEVQHTFNIAGLAFKRNIDQHYPAGAQPLDLSDRREAIPDMRQWCMKNARDGRPDFYTAWRDSPVPPTGQEAYWAKFETMIAECDNLEGFTFAQEIGISEHFEVKGSLRQDVIASVEAIPPMEHDHDASSIPNDSSDYFYNFGSVDALWNGAWGTVRIYRDENAQDPATVSVYNLGNPYFDDGTDSFGIKGRLGGSLYPLEATGIQQITGTGGLACPLPADGTPQKVIRSFLVAVQTEEVWQGVGTDYGAGGRDLDGLMLALLSAEQLGVAFEDADALLALTRSQVTDAIGDAYDAPQPMTLRVNAGDCVQLRYINALVADPQTGGLGDRLGDAPVPPITPLNVGRVSTAPHHGENDGVLEDAVDPQNPGGLRPSASLALSIGLPGMDLADDLPLAFGYQRAGLPPASGGGVTVSDPMLFYAGRMRLNMNFDPALNAIDDDMEEPLREMADAAARRAFATLKTGPETWLSVEGEDILASVSSADFFQFAPLAAGNDAPGIIEVLGQPYSLQFFDFAHPLHFTIFDGTPGQPAALSTTACWSDDMCESAVDILRTALQEALTVELNARTHWIPYAFGPVPVRATGDVISHVQHGLFGAIDVIPRGWEATSAGGQTLYRENDECPENDLGYEICDVGYVKYDEGAFGKYSRDGHPIVYLSKSVDEYGSPQEERTREFILYYQDGLNLHDPDSRIVWKDSEGQTVDGVDGRLKIVPDCEVCDDSYDLGEKAVSYRSVPHSLVALSPDRRVEVSDDLNAFKFASDFVDNPDVLRLSACVGEKIVIRVVHPGGRARQRAFAVNGYDYDDLFPGFGFPRSALLAPGKSISAWLWPKAEAGRFLWHDGPTHIRAGGVWGLLDVTSCD
ncbi:MAG: hypothetical protein WBA90_14800 [Albidovulum sp.]